MKTKFQHIASLGASTALGTGDDKKGGFIERLAKLLNLKAINYGVGGDTTRDMLARIDSLDLAENMLIIITLGINDVPRLNEQDNAIRVSFAEHCQNLEAIITKLKDHASILYLSQFPVDYNACNLEPSVVRTYVTAGLTIAKNCGIPTVAILPHLTKVEPKPKFLAKNGMHFNALGHDFIAKLLQKEINKMEG